MSEFAERIKWIGTVELREQSYYFQDYFGSNKTYREAIRVRA